MNRKQIFAWEIAGFVFISLSGSLLHFAFEFLGEWPPAALIAAVNESVWEHLKLAFWPALLYALIERPFFGRRAKKFWVAKTVGIFVMPAVIVSGFYGYTALAGGHILWADIFLFMLAAFAGQMVSFGLLLRRTFPSSIKLPALILLALMVAAFSLLTFFPPHSPLFCDPRTGQYGIF
jgi:F0F1-type ATP synthase assembly protein I